MDVVFSHLSDSGSQIFPAYWNNLKSLKNTDSYILLSEVVISLVWCIVWERKFIFRRSPVDSNMQPNLRTTSLWIL